MSVKKRIVVVGTKSAVCCFVIAIMLAAVGSASAQTTWGIGVDVLVQAGDNFVEPPASEAGWANHGYNSLTITGGYLELEDVYSGSGPSGGETPANVVIDISGGELQANMLLGISAQLKRRSRSTSR